MNDEGQGKLGVENSEHARPPPKVFRTRKAELISGLSVACLIGIYGFARNVVSDVHSAIKSQNQSIERRLDAIEKQIDVQRRELREAMKELRHGMEKDDERLERRIQWLERAVPQMPQR
jgi:hypothetical protein